MLDARGASDLEQVARELGRDDRGRRRSPATSPIRAHRRALDRRRRERDRPAGQQRQRARPEPAAGAGRLRRSTSSNACIASTSLAPLALAQLALPRLRDGGRIINVTSDAAVEPYEGWGGYGSSKAALDQLTAILAAEQPALRVYAVDPGDMRTRMHQEAFPDEDISDRPSPEESVPGLLDADRRASCRAVVTARARSIPRWARERARLRATGSAGGARAAGGPRRSPATTCRLLVGPARGRVDRAPPLRRAAGAAARRATWSSSTSRRRCRRRSPAVGATARSVRVHVATRAPELDRVLARGRASQRRRRPPGRRGRRARRIAPERRRCARARRPVRVGPAADARSLRARRARRGLPGRARRTDPLRLRRGKGGRSTPTRTCTRPCPGAPRCPAPAGRSRPS